jgi:hypothetical protein
MLLHRGSVLQADDSDFKDAYLMQTSPSDSVFVALEEWGCSSCKRAQWARLRFERLDAEHVRFLDATTVALSPDTIRGVHYITRFIDVWINSGDDDNTRALDLIIGHLIRGR